MWQGSELALDIDNICDKVLKRVTTFWGKYFQMYRLLSIIEFARTNQISAILTWAQFFLFLFSSNFQFWKKSFLCGLPSVPQT